MKKARVWSVHQFFHYLKLQQIIQHNIAIKLPYPKIEKKIAPFLTDDEFNRILNYFTKKATDIKGLRNLVMIMLMGFLGLRTAATQINKVAGLQSTQCLLGHQSIQNTAHYAHLNPDIYAVHMKNHPYMKLDL